MGLQNIEKYLKELGRRPTLQEAKLVLERKWLADCTNIVIAAVATGMFRKGIAWGLVVGFPVGFVIGCILILILK